MNTQYYANTQLRVYTIVHVYTITIDHMIHDTICRHTLIYVFVILYVCST